MHYFAKIQKKDGVYIVSFPEITSINTYGENIRDALSNAEEALNGALESDFERGFSLPKFRDYNIKNYYSILVYPHLEIAFTLRKIRNGKSQSEIANMLGISYQAYQKLENPKKCNPTIKTLEKISNVLGKKLEVIFS